MIQYQFEGNHHFVYVIVRRRALFQRLIGLGAQLPAILPAPATQSPAAAPAPPPQTAAPAAADAQPAAPSTSEADVVTEEPESPTTAAAAAAAAAAQAPPEPAAAQAQPAAPPAAPATPRPPQAASLRPVPTAAFSPSVDVSDKVSVSHPVFLLFIYLFILFLFLLLLLLFHALRQVVKGAKPQIWSSLPPSEGGEHFSVATPGKVPNTPQAAAAGTNILPVHQEPEAPFHATQDWV